MNDKDINQAFSAFKSTPVQPIDPISTAPIFPVTATELYGDVKVEAKATPITARLNYTEVGICPYCNQPTQKVECCDQIVFLCENDRFVSPLPNSEQG